MPHLNKD